MDRICEVTVETLRAALQTAGDRIDMVYFYDDVGAQESLLISKAMWRKYIKPFHQKIIDTAKGFGKAVMYHCDGAIYPLLDELIDMGIDVLNPIQPNAKGMAPALLKQDFGDRLCFWGGGCDTQTVLPFGTPEEVYAHTRQNIDIFAPGSGFVFTQVHNIQAGVPVDNILAMFQAVQDSQK
jgi:uroporphyrinogen decarboxylase